MFFGSIQISLDLSFVDQESKVENRSRTVAVLLFLKPLMVRIRCHDLERHLFTHFFT